MGFGAPWNFADATFAFKIIGDGRHDHYVYRPVSPQSFVAWSPPGALTTQSLLSRRRQNVSSGAVVLENGTTLAGFSPWTASYIVIVPPANSTVGKTMMGNVTDVGIPLIPNLPNIIALPNPVPTTWQLLYNMSGSEDLDIYIF